VDAAVQKAVVSHCERLNRFAILDGQQTSTQTSAAINLAGSSSYAAVYHPWIDIGLTRETGAGSNKRKVTVYQPPSGHIAGVFARVDAERGVHKAPANEIIRGALGVQTAVSKAQQDGLNPHGINVIRPFGADVKIWGARTTSTETEWRYISSRRLFTYLRDSLEDGTQWVVFEPNAPELWSRVRRNVTAFLTTVWASGALLGTTPDQAFYVRCDETTNPPEVRDLGQLVTEIGVALVKPAEFVVFRLSQWSGPGA
jgi:phage tail sheath protein FI